MFFADRYYGFDDAMYAACRLMEIVAQAGQPLSAQLAGPAEDGDHAGDPVRLSRRAEVRRGAAGDARRCARSTRVDVDGVRVLFPEGWGLVRASNTQPVLVMRFEATSAELLAEYRREVEGVVEAAKTAAVG